MNDFPQGVERYIQHTVNRRCQKAFLASLRDKSFEVKYFYYYRNSWDRYRRNFPPYEIQPTVTVEYNFQMKVDLNE